MPRSIKIRESIPGSLLDVVNLLLEYLLFFRWIYFKNRPRGNLLLVRAILAVSVQGSLYFWFFGHWEFVLEGIEIDPVIALGIAVTVAYWNMANTFQIKTRHCLEGLRKVMESYADGAQAKGQLLAAELAHEILVMDLWAHRSFQEFFVRQVEQAITGAYQGGKPEQNSQQDWQRDFEKGCFTEAQLQQLLVGYRNHLLADITLAA